MKSQIFILLSLAVSSHAYSQTGRVGINTENPQQTFHIDGGKDNPTTGVPSAAQQVNDVVVSSFGQLGVGTSQPRAKLHVTGGIATQIDTELRVNGSSTTDGDPGTAGQVLTSRGTLNSPIWQTIPAAATITADNGLTKTGNNIQLGGILLRNTDIATAGFNTTFSGTGNVGIGSSATPAEKLVVSGNSNISGKLRVGTTFNDGALSIRNNVASEYIASFVSSGNLYRAVMLDNGNFGLGGLTAPTENLDVNNNIRVRGITTNVGNGTTDRRVVADTNGVLKTIDNEDYNFFHSRLISNQTLSSTALSNTVLFGTPIATSPFYTYNTSTGILTFNSSGLYFITYQGGFTEFAAGTHLLLGIVNVATGQYIGRGSNWSALARTGDVGQISSYTTMINVPSSGFQIRFIAFAGASGNAILLANETGASGTGNVTNLTIQKTR